MGSQMTNDKSPMTNAGGRDGRPSARMSVPISDFTGIRSAVGHLSLGFGHYPRLFANTLANSRGLALLQRAQFGIRIAQPDG
jgi:hypothetical protein